MHGVWAAKGERPERPSAAPSYPWQCCWEAPELTRTLTRTRSLTVTPWQCCWEPEIYELWGGGAPFTQEGTAPNPNPNPYPNPNPNPYPYPNPNPNQAAGARTGGGGAAVAAVAAVAGLWIGGVGPRGRLRPHV